MEWLKRLFPKRFKCPDCGGRKFLYGPAGGMSINFACANHECWARFNDMAVFGINRHGKVGERDRYLFKGPFQPRSTKLMEVW